MYEPRIPPEPPPSRQGQRDWLLPFACGAFGILFDVPEATIYGLAAAALVVVCSLQSVSHYGAPLLDSGAGKTIFGMSQVGLLDGESIEPSTDRTPLQGPWGGAVAADFQGTYRFLRERLSCLVVKSMHVAVVSVYAVCVGSDHGENVILFDSRGYMIFDAQLSAREIAALRNSTGLWNSGEQRHGVYPVDLLGSTPVCVMTPVPLNRARVVHFCTAHASDKTMQWHRKNSLNCQFNDAEQVACRKVCPGCVQGGMIATRKDHYSSQRSIPAIAGNCFELDRAGKFGESLHVGDTKSFGGYYYFSLLVDLYTHRLYPLFTRTKEAKEFVQVLRRHFVEWPEHMLNPEQTRPLWRFIRCDDDTTFVSQEVKAFLSLTPGLRYSVEPGPAYYHVSQGHVERSIGHVEHKANVLLMQAGLPIQFWVHAVEYVCFTHALNPHSTIQTSPMLLETGLKADFRYLHPFGARCWVWVSLAARYANVKKREDVTAKMGQPYAYMARFVGYVNPRLCFPHYYVRRELSANAWGPLQASRNLIFESEDGFSADLSPTEPRFLELLRIRYPRRFAKEQSLRQLVESGTDDQLAEAFAETRPGTADDWDLDPAPTDLVVPLQGDTVLANDPFAVLGPPPPPTGLETSMDVRLSHPESLEYFAVIDPLPQPPAGLETAMALAADVIDTIFSQALPEGEPPLDARVEPIGVAETFTPDELLAAPTEPLPTAVLEEFAATAQVPVPSRRSRQRVTPRQVEGRTPTTVAVEPPTPSALPDTLRVITRHCSRKNNARFPVQRLVGAGHSSVRRVKFTLPTETIPRVAVERPFTEGPYGLRNRVTRVLPLLRQRVPAHGSADFVPEHRQPEYHHPFRPLDEYEGDMVELLAEVNQANYYHVFRLNYKDDPDVPRWFADALNHRDGRWREALYKEMDKMETNCIFLLVPDRGQPRVRTNWLFEIKDDDTHKARLVGRGDMMKPGIHFSADGETFATNVQPTSIRKTLSIAAKLNLLMRGGDIDGAYLVTRAKERVCVYTPEGYYCPPGYVFEVDGNLYGFRTSAKCFSDKFDECATAAGFVAYPEDRKWFHKYHSDGRLTMMLVHSDDFRIFAHSTHSEEYASFVAVLGKHGFGVKETTDKPFVGVMIRRDAEGNYTADQSEYVDAIVAKVEQIMGITILLRDCPHPRQPQGRFKETDTSAQPSKADCKSTWWSTEHDKLSQLPATSQSARAAALAVAAAKVDICPYGETIGKLHYVATHTGVTIAHDLSVLSRYTLDPGPKHVEYLLHMLGYLKRTRGSCLKFKTVLGQFEDGLVTPEVLSHLQLKFYVDSGLHSCADTGRAMECYLGFLGDSLISWSSHRQACVATGTCESELMALTRLCKDQVVSWRRLLDRMRITQAPTIIYEDNLSVVHVSKMGNEIPKLLRHIDLAQLFFQYLSNMGAIKVEHIVSKKNLADIGTKYVPTEDFVMYEGDLVSPITWTTNTT